MRKHGLSCSKMLARTAILLVRAINSGRGKNGPARPRARPPLTAHEAQRTGSPQRPANSLRHNGLAAACRRTVPLGKPGAPLRAGCVADA